jgi:hypothetical protein
MRQGNLIPQPTRSGGRPRRRLLVAVASLLLLLAIPACAAAKGQRHPARRYQPQAIYQGAPRLFSPTSIWNRPLAAGAPIDPGSGAMVSALSAEAANEEQIGTGPWIETTDDSTTIYRVGPDQPNVPVQLEDPTESWRASLQAAFDAVPIPADAQPAEGPDAQMVVWQPSTNKMWEFYEMQRESDGWHAAWGGAMRDVSRNPGYYSPRAWPGALSNWGATASSLPIAGGVITLADIQRGVIDHALAIDLPYPRADVWAWPAQRTDGTGTEPGAIPEGAHLRLDPSLDIPALHLPRLVQMMAEAAQRYGIVVRDQTHHAIGFFIQDPTPTGSNPFANSNGTPSATGPFQGMWPNDLLKYFPWSHLEVLKMRLEGPTSTGS